MDVGLQITVETKQALSQKQVESLAILSMPSAELHEFLQKEEIENPLLDYSMAEPDSEKKPGTKAEPGITVNIREHQMFYGNHGRADGAGQALYEIPDEDASVEELVMSQIPAGILPEEEQKAASYAVQLLDDNGFLKISAAEIAADLNISAEAAEHCLRVLKGLEPKGIFAENLAECLELQTAGMEDEELLTRIIREHLLDIAEGKISQITRSLMISSVRARQLIAVIRGLNPRPLNGCAGRKTEYVIPDILFSYADGQWTIELNDNWGGHPGVNDFYVRMLEQTQDAELKAYFQEKLSRARFITSSVEQRRETLLKIASFVLEKQAGYFCGREPLRTMTMEETARTVSLNSSTVSRAVKGKYYSSPGVSGSLRELFTSGTLSSGTSSSGSPEGGVSQDAAKRCLKEVIDGENKEKPYSDEKLSVLLKGKGIEISRRTVAKYRSELGIAGTSARKR